MENKTRLIVPTVMLIAAAVASIIMLIKNYEFYTMLWTLLIVLIVFYVIGDVVRYIYSSVRPCILPQSPDLENLLAKMNDTQEEEDEVVELEADSSVEEGDESAYESVDAQEMTEDSEAREEYEDFDGAFDESYEEYTDENLDEM